jgi:hypothetical protein
MKDTERELTPQEVERKEKAEARVLAMQNARTLVRANKEAILEALSDHEFFDEELSDALKLVIGNERGTGGRKRAKTGAKRVTKIDIILGMFREQEGEDEEGNPIFGEPVVGKSVTDLDIFLASRAKKLGMGVNEIKHQIVKNTKDNGVYVDIEEDEEGGMKYTYLGTDGSGLHYEINV